MIEVAIIKHKVSEGHKKTHTVKSFKSQEEARKFVGEYNERKYDVLVDYATVVVSW